MTMIRTDAAVIIQDLTIAAAAVRVTAADFESAAAAVKNAANVAIESVADSALTLPDTDGLAPDTAAADIAAAVAELNRCRRIAADAERGVDMAAADAADVAADALYLLKSNAADYRHIIELHNQISTINDNADGAKYAADNMPLANESDAVESAVSELIAATNSMINAAKVAEHAAYIAKVRAATDLADYFGGLYNAVFGVDTDAADAFRLVGNIAAAKAISSAPQLGGGGLSESSAATPFIRRLLNALNDLMR